MKTAIAIDRIDHIVLTVRDVEETCRFYVKALGMEETTFGNGRKALKFGRQKTISIRRAANSNPRPPFPSRARPIFVS